MGDAATRVRPLSYKEIILFWFPLGVMWVMMAVEQPALSAAIARMDQAQLNLAAFGVVFAIAVVAESPIIQMLAAATALADNRQSYRLLLRFMHIMAISLTALHLLIALTPIFDLVVAGLLGVPERVVEASRLPFLVMAPFSAAVGYRRLWQGVLIRNGKTWIVPVSMVTRLAMLMIVLIVGATSNRLPGALLASIALASAVTVGAVVAALFNTTLVMPKLPEATGSESILRWRRLLRFYVPLALTTVVFLIARPAVTFGIARAELAEESLAVWPVISGFIFLFNSVALSNQESSIALLKRSPQSRRRLGRFTLALAAALTMLVIATALTPLGAWWFERVSGLEPGLFRLTGTPVLILCIVPALVAYKAWYRALYVSSGRTTVLTQGVTVYTVVLFTLIFLGATWLNIAGATLAAGAMTVAQTLENAYLLSRRPEVGFVERSGEERP
jgi:hypothetical protein